MMGRVLREVIRLAVVVIPVYLKHFRPSKVLSHILSYLILQIALWLATVKRVLNSEQKIILQQLGDLGLFFQPLGAQSLSRV